MDEREFAQALTEHREKVYRLAMRMTGNHQEALDITQETLLSAFQHRRRFRGEARLTTWLYRIGLNHAYACLKRRKQVLIPLDKAQELVDQGRNPAQSFQHKTKAESVRRMVAFLPPRQKAAVHLRIWEGLSFGEVAGVLACRESTARTLYFFGLRKLRERLGETGVKKLEAEA